MKKKRTKLPNSLRDKILVEFNHQCVVCSAFFHEVHHIDEDPSNHAEDNLIVLCPNCHKGKVHGKSIRITPGQLKLYLRTRKKSAFNPIYHILSSRIDFLHGDNYMQLPGDDLSKNIDDLIKFVKHLKMGDYYSNRLRKLFPIYARMLSRSMRDRSEHREREIEEDRKERVRKNKEEAIKLVFECLEVQD